MNSIELIKLDESLLQYITRMAAAAFTPAEIAEVLEAPEIEFNQEIEENDSPIRKAYRSGFLTRQLELRERIFQDAKNGSSPAQTIANKLMDNCMIKSRI
jgi:DNA-binding transcriptional MerR regulator